MTAPIRDPSKFTPLGLFVHQYCRPSEMGLVVMNTDYVVYDYARRRLQIIEEKADGEALGFSQNATLRMLDTIFRAGASAARVDYWGVFVVRLPKGCTHVGPGVRINGVAVTVEQLVAHLNLDAQATTPLNPVVAGQLSLDGAVRRHDGQPV